MESNGNPPQDGEDRDATRSDGKRAENGDGITAAERAARDAKGRFGKGNQAAVGHGRPKKDFDVETACADWTPDIVAHFGYQGSIAQTGAQVEMGKAVLAYHLGKPRVRVEHSGPGGRPIEVVAMTTEQKKAQARAIAKRLAERVAAGAQRALPMINDGDDAAAEEGESTPEDAGADGAAGAE